MALSKLNQRGVLHWTMILPVLVILAVAAIGVKVLTQSHALTPEPSTTLSSNGLTSRPSEPSSAAAGEAVKPEQLSNATKAPDTVSGNTAANTTAPNATTTTTYDWRGITDFTAINDGGRYMKTRVAFQHASSGYDRPYVAFHCYVNSKAYPCSVSDSSGDLYGRNSTGWYSLTSMTLYNPNSGTDGFMEFYGPWHSGSGYEECETTADVHKFGLYGKYFDLHRIYGNSSLCT